MTQGAPRLLTPAELKALRPANPLTGGTVTLWGREVPWRPLTVAIYDRFILSRFEAPLAFFSLGSQVALAQQAIEAAQAEGREPDPADLVAVDGKGYTESQAKDGGAANMAFISAGIGAPGDVDIERQLLDASDEELTEALTTIEYGTWGDDPARFFAQVGKGLAGRSLTVLQAASSRRPSGTTRTTSTRTGGKATTARPPNRKSRRQAGSKGRGRKATSA